MMLIESAGARYLAGRLATTVLIILGAMLLLFALGALVPGDPATTLLGPQATPEYAARFIERMGLDRPLYERFLIFFSNVLTGDLGEDVITGRPVSGLVLAVLPYTLVLTLSSIGFAVSVGIPLGVCSARYPGTKIDALVAFSSVAFIAIPAFVIAVLLLVAFAVWLPWFPVLGAGDTSSPVDQARRLILPSIALGIGWVGMIARLIRSSLLEVLGSDYIRTARAYGLPESKIVYKYALKNASIPTVAVLGLGIGRLLGGAVLIEIIFARPGLGRLVFDAIATRNFPVLQGSVLIVVILFTLTNLLVDLSYSALDPRIRHGMKSGGAAA
ncbi:ABC transporter permease [Ensifer adhaerens]|uniref:ABC transporter permease n=1 Tax=Ensifer adhaerens TaxID=106592 RepID=UPI001FEE9645|nr:ABC transporter permease [Ensifer adhaerens]